MAHAVLPPRRCFKVRSLPLVPESVAGEVGWSTGGGGGINRAPQNRGGFGNRAQLTMNQF